MKAFVWLIAVTCALSTFFSAQALAQNVQGYTGMEGTQAVQHFLKADDLIGRNVIGINGTSVGKMESFIIGQKGEVKYLLLSKTGAVIRLNVPSSKIENAPTFSDATFGQDWEQNVQSCFADKGTVPGSTEMDKSGIDKFQGPLNSATADQGELEQDQGAVAGQMDTSETKGDIQTGMIESNSFESSSRLSSLLGKYMFTQKGSKVGKLQDVIFDRNGDAQFAIISSGGFLGFRKKHVAVPWNLVEVLPDQNLLVNVAADKLNKAPSYSDESFSPEWENRVRAYYGAPARTDAGARTPRAMGGAGSFKTSDLMNKNVVSEQGFMIGRIEDVVLSKDGKIDYLFISREGGARGKFVVVPWQAAKFEPQRDQVTLMISKDKLDNAPVVSDNDWQKINDPDWTRQLRGYYGVDSGPEMQKPGMQEPMTEHAPMGEFSEGTSGTY